MSQKLKFKPVITRVKLNPEQAVLQCGGYRYGWGHDRGTTHVTDGGACWEYIRMMDNSEMANRDNPTS